MKPSQERSRQAAEGEPERAVEVEVDRSVASAEGTGELSAVLIQRLDAATMKLSSPSSSRHLRKSVKAIFSYPLNGEHNATTRKLLNAMVAHAQDVFARLKPEEREAIKAVRGTPLFRAPVKRLMVLMGFENSNNYDRVYESLAAMHAWTINWDVLEETDDGIVVVEEVTSRLLSQWGKGLAGRAGEVTYEIPFETLSLLLEPNPYTRIDLGVVNQLSSGAAIALYESCARFLGTTNKVTSILPVDQWISIIAGHGKYENRYKDFSRYVLRPAIETLRKTDSCPFNVEARPVHGPNRKVNALQFKMTLKEQPDLPMAMPITWDPRRIHVLRTVYEMSEHDVIILARTATEAEVTEAMERARAMMARKAQAGDPVKNKAAYLRGILRNLHEGKSRLAEPESDPVEVASQTVQQAMTAVEKMREAFETFRFQRLKEELAKLDQETLQALRKEFEADRGADGAVGKWVREGWEKRGTALGSMFASWIMKAKPDMVSDLLKRPEESELAVWMMLNAKLQAPGGK